MRARTSSATSPGRPQRLRHSAAVRRRAASAGGRRRATCAAWPCDHAAGSARSMKRQGEGTRAQSEGDSGRRPGARRKSVGDQPVRARVAGGQGSQRGGGGPGIQQGAGRCSAVQAGLGVWPPHADAKGHHERPLQRRDAGAHDCSRLQQQRWPPAASAPVFKIVTTARVRLIINQTMLRTVVGAAVAPSWPPATVAAAGEKHVRACVRRPAGDPHSAPQTACARLQARGRSVVDPT